MNVRHWLRRSSPQRYLHAIFLDERFRNDQCLCISSRAICRASVRCIKEEALEKKKYARLSQSFSDRMELTWSHGACG